LKSTLNRLSSTSSNVSEALSRFTLDIAQAKSEGTIYAMLAERLPQILSADRCSVALLNESTGEIEIYALSGNEGSLSIGTTISFKNSFIGQAIIDKKTYHHHQFEQCKQEDAKLLLQQGIKSCINAPIHFSHKTVGTINVGSYKDDIYGKNSVDLLDLVTSIVSTNLERQRLLEQAQSNIQHYRDYTYQLEELASVSKKLSSATREEDVFSVITDSAKQITSADRVTFTVPIPGKNEFSIKRILSSHENFVSQSNFLITGTSIADVINRGEGRFFPNLDENEYTDHRLLSSMGLKTAWGVPVKVNGEVIGSLNAASASKIEDGSQLLRIMTMLSDIMTATLSRIELQSELAFRASFDELTGLPNKSQLNRIMQSKVKAFDSPPYTVLFIDLDRFKAVNDTLGHEIGDRILCTVSYRMKRQLGEKDIISRHGGDEFVILLDECMDNQQANCIAENIINTIKAPIHVGPHEIYIGSSIGLTKFPEHSTTPSELIKFADIAMYYAKKSGENKIKWYSKELLKEVGLKQRIDNDLRKALQNNELFLVYQPLFKDNKVNGVEVLLRWKHLELGYISPDVFCKIAEERGFIHEVTYWVIKNSLAFIKKLHIEYPSIYASINISAKDCLNSENLQQVVLDTLAKNSIPGDKLELEITENIHLQDIEQTKSLFESLKSHGVRLAIDDFGTGYSSLTYLLSLPFDTLKIDRSFVQNIHANRNQKDIVKGIIGVANSLSMSCIAEGIEKIEQQECLVGLGCTRFQGYLLCKPLEEYRLMSFLQNNPEKV
jgi:diguanylate cyclase (GGDEF)-like protein